MARLLLIALVGFIAYFLVKSYFNKLNQPRRRSDAPGDDKNGEKTMVRCAHCGIHAPRADSVLENGKYFCSEEHLRLGEKNEA
ncbi:MAG: PP0621 family protein [Burkholderiales bacterium]